MLTIQNPILKGFYPDPSICRVGEDYYLVNSSFSYFPGVPLFHSRDLGHWEQVGNILDRPEQLPLEGDEISRGIFAPVIRWHKGTFYMITTNVDQGGTFVVTSKTPEGPWSDPFYLGEEAKGIDPSLFFDEDGTCYYVGTRPNSNGVHYNGDWEIWLQELDLEKMSLTGESRTIWKGAMQNAIWPEGPHLYRIGEYYYLLHAEGGTAEDHCICVARTRSLKEPFEGCPRNPVFTHRHLGLEFPVTCAGHGDLVDDGQGNWYIVMLACRRCKGCSSMGRETFLAKVQWENGWPVINPGIGKLEEKLELPMEAVRFPREASEDVFFEFHKGQLPKELISIYGRDPEMYSLSERPGFLRLQAGKHHVGEKAVSTYVGVRQMSYTFTTSLGMEFIPKDSHSGAGFLLFQNHRNFLRAEIRMQNQNSILCVIETIDGQEKVLKTTSIEKGLVEILFQVEEQLGKISIVQNEEVREVAGDIDLRPYSTEYAGGFVGCTMGMYASSYGMESKDYADVAWFAIRN